MKTEELIEFLGAHPGKDVEILTETMVSPVLRAEIDLFDQDQGPIVLLIPEDEVE